MKNNVTMKDIAQRVGVSSVTVSKALNDKEGVSDELREKIKALAEEMGYRYNTVAKAMKEGLTYNIGVIIPERFAGLPEESFYLRVYHQMSTVLERYGYYGILNILKSEDEEQLILPRLYFENRVDGFIFLGQLHKDYIETLASHMDAPKVFLDFYDEHVDVDAVITDNFYGAYEITNYLINQGHREIAYVGNLYSTSSIQDRFLGYYKSLLEHRLILRQDYIIKDRDDQGKYIDITLPQPMPTAFVCNCDQVAHNLIKTLKSSGYRVPEDCSVVGFDNDIYATVSSPKITTVEVDTNEMAETAVKILVDEIKNPAQKYGRVLVKGRIIYRESVKKQEQPVFKF